MEHSTSVSPSGENLSFQYVVGIDIGSESCSFCTLKPDKSQVFKPTEFTNAAPGFALRSKKLEGLNIEPKQVLIGLEATSRDAGESLSLFGKARLSALSAPPETNPSVCTTTRAPSEN